MFNHHSLFFRCVKLQFGGEETQNEAWSWLAANQLSSFVNTKESRFDFIHLNFNDSKEFRHLSFFLLKIFLLLHASSATDEAWRLLASYLDRFSSSNAQYHRCVINKLLSHGVPLPDWLVKSYKVRDLPIERGETVDVDVICIQTNPGYFPMMHCCVFQAVDAASLLRLFLNFDQLDAAAELVLEYVDALLGKGHQYFGIEVLQKISTLVH